MQITDTEFLLRLSSHTSNREDAQRLARIAADVQRYETSHRKFVNDFHISRTELEYARDPHDAKNLLTWHLTSRCHALCESLIKGGAFEVVKRVPVTDQQHTLGGELWSVEVTALMPGAADFRARQP